MTRLLALAALLLALLPAPAAAQAYPVDDSASPVLDGNVRIRWDDPMLEDTFHVTLQADGDRLPDHSRLEFTFEIEPESP